LALGKEPAHASQASLWILGLLGAALAVLSFRKTPTSPTDDADKPVRPETITFKCEHETPPWKRKLEYGGVAIALGLLIMNIFLWYSTRNATRIASRQLEMADRPWIKDAVRSASELTAQHGAFSWAVVIRTENVGHSVATAIYPQAKLIAIHGADFIDAPRLQARQLCDEVSARFERVKNDPVVWSNAIFPEEWSEFVSNAVLLPTDIKDASLDGKSFTPMLIGCIEYHYATSDKPHHTWFVYTLAHNDDPTLPEPSRVFFSIDKNVPQANMVLIKADQYAD
jgi:hypothetical protein